MRNFIILLISFSLLPTILWANEDLERVIKERDECEMDEIKKAIEEKVPNKIKGVAKQIQKHLSKDAQCVKENGDCIWKIISLLQKLAEQEAYQVLDIISEAGKKANSTMWPKVNATVEAIAQEEYKLGIAEGANPAADEEDTSAKNQAQPIVVAPDGGYA